MWAPPSAPWLPGALPLLLLWCARLFFWLGRPSRPVGWWWFLYLLHFGQLLRLDLGLPLNLLAVGAVAQELLVWLPPPRVPQEVAAAQNLPQVVQLGPPQEVMPPVHRGPPRGESHSDLVRLRSTCAAGTVDCPQRPQGTVAHGSRLQGGLSTTHFPWQEGHPGEGIHHTTLKPNAKVRTYIGVSLNPGQITIWYIYIYIYIYI